MVNHHMKKTACGRICLEPWKKHFFCKSKKLFFVAWDSLQNLYIYDMFVCIFTYIYICENIIRYKVSEVFLLFSLCFKCCFCLSNVSSCIVQQMLSLWQLGPGGGFHCLFNVRTYMWKIISWFWSVFWVPKHLLTGGAVGT